MFHTVIPNGRLRLDAPTLVWFALFIFVRSYPGCEICASLLGFLGIRKKEGLWSLFILKETLAFGQNLLAPQRSSFLLCWKACFPAWSLFSWSWKQFCEHLRLKKKTKNPLLILQVLYKSLQTLVLLAGGLSLLSPLYSDNLRLVSRSGCRNL